MNITGGSTDVTTYVALTLLADGTDATGLTITDLDLQYCRSGASPAAKVDATALAAVNSAHGDNQAIEVDATDQPGLYRVDWPDAAFAAGVKEVVLSVKHTSCKTAHLRVTIDAPVNVTSLNADQQSLTDLKDFADAGYDPSTNKVTGVVLVDTLTTYTGNTPQTADHTANIAALQTDVDDILADTNELQTDWANGGRLDLLLDAVPKLLATGTAQSATSSTIVLAASTSFADNILNGNVVKIISGTGAGQARVISDWVSATDTATVEPNWATNPSSDSVYEIVDGSVNIVTGSSNSATLQLGFLNVGGAVHYLLADVQAWASGTVAVTSSGIPRVQVISIDNDTITEAAIANGAIDAATFAADVDAEVRSWLGLASANLDTQLADLPTVAEFNARTLASADYFDPAADTVANVTTVGSVTTKTGYKLASDGLDLVLVAGVALPESLRRIGTIVAGEVADAGTGVETFTDWAGSVNTIVVTVDASGNRTSVAFN